MGWRREPWDPPRGGRILLVAAVVVGIVLLLVVFGVYVEVIQPAAFRFAGARVEDLGGSQRAANLVVGGTYLTAVGVAYAWTRLLRARGLRPVVVVTGLAALPLWIFAIGLAPPTRDGDESAALISGWVGDEVLGTRLDDAMVVGVGLVLAAVGVWWLVQRTAADPRDEEIASRLERF